jgi:hypothetical protein
LISNTTYTFRVYATNLTGNSARSLPSNPVLAGPLGSPTIGTATLSGAAAASITFTAPVTNGGSAVTSYTVVSSPGGLTASGASSPITVSGLISDTTYTFTVYATNQYGNSPDSSPSNSVLAGIIGQVAYTVPGTYSWTAPASVRSVSVVAIGGGSSGKYGGPTYNGLYANGGGGGGLGWKNNITVVPGQSYAVVVGVAGVASGQMYDRGIAGGDSYFISASIVKGGGAPGALNGAQYSPGGTYVGDGGGNGGQGGYENADFQNAGGGGAGGYSGTGGTGGLSNGGSGSAGSGGGGGGGGAGGRAGGGTGILGQGTDGTGGGPNVNGGGGSGGFNGSAGTGGAYGGGGGGQNGPGGVGAVRIIWGSGRSFPSNFAVDS